jgi:predicted alpha/beta hydrolase family esterase
VSFEDLPNDLPGIPILLREARGAYAGAIRVAIAAAGLPELPTNGPLIVGGLHEGAVSFSRLVDQRRKSIEKSQTIDKLRDAGYLIGSEDDPILSESGHQAAHIVLDSIVHLTESLNQLLGDDGMKAFVTGLLFLSNEKVTHA